MKILVGAACVAVIAFVGYYFLGEYTRADAAGQAANLAAFARICDSMGTSDTSGLSNDQVSACADYTMSGKPADFIPPP